MPNRLSPACSICGMPDCGCKDKYYNSKAWRNYSKDRLKQHPFCERCGGMDRCLTDHIVPVAIRQDLYMTASNHQTLCTPCHDAKRRQGL